jgi:type II pantothenate kinase
MMQAHAHSLQPVTLSLPGVLPPDVAGIDAGMTMTKTARRLDGTIDLRAQETASLEVGSWETLRSGARRAGVTGARASAVTLSNGVVAVQEIEAAGRGCAALLEADGRLGSGEFLMGLMGTGTAFAAVRDGSAQHLGGTPLGGGSFAGIAYRIAPELPYEELIAAAERGDRRAVDVMIADVYPDGIGRVEPDLTAAHLSKKGAGTREDVLAGLLNLHGESIAQIAAGRARMANLSRLVLCGGFVHNNPRLVESIAHMAGLFGLVAETVQAPGYAGAIGAALMAAEG